jgi:hypothetical protein
MHRKDPYGLRTKSTEAVCEWIAGWNEKNGAGKRLIGMQELRRRLSRPEAIRSWIAVGISLVAVLVALLKG